MGDFYHINIRPKSRFVAFRNHDVGDPGHVERVAAQRESGSWDTQAWLVSKEDAHIEDDKLIPDTEDARTLLEGLGSEPVHVRGDIFKAKPRQRQKQT